jgi:hypothetical protein
MDSKRAGDIDCILVFIFLPTSGRTIVSYQAGKLEELEHGRDMSAPQGPRCRRLTAAVLLLFRSAPSPMM